MTSPPSLRYPCFHPFLIISYVCLTICLSVSLLKTLPTSSLGYARTPGSATKWPLLKAALYNLLVTLRVCPTNWNVCVPACVCVCVCCTLHVYIHEWTTTPHKRVPLLASLLLPIKQELFWFLRSWFREVWHHGRYWNGEGSRNECQCLHNSLR